MSLLNIKERLTFLLRRGFNRYSSSFKALYCKNYLKKMKKVSFILTKMLQKKLFVKEKSLFPLF
jgi:hypothetical protein